MRLFTHPVAPNPTRVMIYLGEKSIQLETVRIELRSGEQRSPEHLARNPLGSLPVLELDDRSYLTESATIVEYLEELYPEPPMIGTSPLERAHTRRLDRIADLSVLLPIGRIIHATNSPIGLPKSTEVAERARVGLADALKVLEAVLGEAEFLGGDRPSVADCTLFAALQFGRIFKVSLETDVPAMDLWYDRFAKRPSVPFANT